MRGTIALLPVHPLHLQFQPLLWVAMRLHVLAATGVQVYLGYTATDVLSQVAPAGLVAAEKVWVGTAFPRTKVSIHCILSLRNWPAWGSQWSEEFPKGTHTKKKIYLFILAWDRDFYATLDKRHKPPRWPGHYCSIKVNENQWSKNTLVSAW